MKKEGQENVTTGRINEQIFVKGKMTPFLHSG